MSESMTIARPYAKAIFEYAVETDTLALWSSYLQCLAETVALPEVLPFIANPESTEAQQVALLMVALEGDKKQSKELKHLVQLLVINKRVRFLPEIAALYTALRNEHEKTLEAEVVSFSALSEAQEDRLVAALTKRLKRQITLKSRVDASLLGGAIIFAGDWVIDGSIRGQLQKMKVHLAI